MSLLSISVDHPTAQLIKTFQALEISGKPIRFGGLTFPQRTALRLTNTFEMTQPCEAKAAQPISKIAPPIIVLTDIGSDADDALALWALAKHAPDRLRGVVTTFGPTQLRASIAREILASAGVTHVPVVAGSPFPVGRARSLFLTGSEGLNIIQDSELQKLTQAEKHVYSAWSCTHTQSSWLRESSHAEGARFILDTVNKEPGTTILALGGLTDLALASALDPEFAHKVGRVVFMGGKRVDRTPWDGSYTVGKTSHNESQDLQAAQYIYETFDNICAIPGTLTRRPSLRINTAMLLDKIEHSNANITLGTSVRTWAMHMNRGRGLLSPYIYIHDVIAAAEAVEPGRFIVQHKGCFGMASDYQHIAFATGALGPHACATDTTDHAVSDWLLHTFP